MKKKDMLAGILVTLFLVILSEGLPRLFFKALDFPHPNTFLIPDKELGWKPEPGYHKKWIHINAFGFRGEEISRNKPPHTFRIAALGESSTFGYGDDPESPYPLQLERALNKNKTENCSMHYEVVNAGVEKYFSWQVAKHFERDVLPLKPDVILVYMGWNDLYVVNPDTGTIVNPQSVFNRLISKSLTLRMLTVSVYRFILPHFEKINPCREALYENFNPAMLRKNYHALIQTAKKNHIAVVMVTLPSLLGSHDLSRHVRLLHFPYFTHNIKLLSLLWNAYNRALRDMAEKEGVTLVDLDEHFKNMPQSSTLFMDTLHPNKEGNRRIAVVLAESMALENVFHCNHAAR